MLLLSLLLLLSLSFTSSQTCQPIRQLQLNNTGMKDMIVQGDALYVRFNSVVEQYSLTNMSLMSTFSTAILGPNPVKMIVDQNHVIYSFNRTHVTRISRSGPFATTGTVLSSQSISAAVGVPTADVYVMDAAVSPSNIVHVLSNHGRGSSLFVLPYNNAQSISRQEIQLYSLYNMYIGRNGTVYVQDNTPAQIQIVAYTPYPELQASRHLAPVMFLTNSFVVDTQARTYVIDMNTPRITAYTEEDIFINHIQPLNLVSPYQLRLTSNGRLLIADNATSIIHVVSDVDCYLHSTASSSTGSAGCPDIVVFQPNAQKGELLDSWSFNHTYWPTSIDIGENGLLYATANLQRYVFIASLEGDGAVLETINRVGNNTLTPAVWSAKLDGSGNWWILDYGGRSLIKWGLETGDVDTWTIFWWYYISAVAVVPDASRWAIKAYTYGAMYQFDHEGTYLCTMTGPSTYWGGAVYDEQGDLWIADYHTLYQFSPNCTMLARIEGFDRLSEIAMDTSGLLYLAHRNTSRDDTGSVLVFDPVIRTVIDEFGEFYTDDVTPTALALDSDNNVYVSEGSSILKFAKRYSTTVSPPIYCPSTAPPTAQPTSTPTSSTAVPNLSSSSVDRSTSQPIDQSTSQPSTSQQIDQSTSQPSTGQPIDQSTSHPSTSQPIDVPDFSSSSTAIREPVGPGDANSASSTSLHLSSFLVTFIVVFLMF